MDAATAQPTMDGIMMDLCVKQYIEPSRALHPYGMLASAFNQLGYKRTNYADSIGNQEPSVWWQLWQRHDYVPVSFLPITHANPSQSSAVAFSVDRVGNTDFIGWLFMTKPEVKPDLEEILCNIQAIAQHQQAKDGRLGSLYHRLMRMAGKKQAGAEAQPCFSNLGNYLLGEEAASALRKERADKEYQEALIWSYDQLAALGVPIAKDRFVHMIQLMKYFGVDTVRQVTEIMTPYVNLPIDTFVGVVMRRSGVLFPAKRIELGV